MSLTTVGLLSFGGWLVAEQGWIAAKARLASLLIDRAFEAHLRDGRVHRPWEWADTHPLGCSAGTGR